MKEFKQIFIREIKRILKSKDLILICLIAPFVYSFGITYIYHYKSPKDLKIAIVNKDNSSISRDFIRMLDSTSELNISDYYPSTASAYKAIFDNEIDIFYYLPKNFSANLKKGKSSFAFIGANASNFMVSSTAIKTVVMTSQVLAGEILVKFLLNNNIPKQMAQRIVQPIQIQTKWLYNPIKAYSMFFVPFVLLAIFQQILIVAVCHTMTTETQEKTWKELFILSNKKIAPILIGKALPYIIIAFFIIVSFIFLVFPFTDIAQNSKFNLLFISAVYSVIIIFFAMMISHLFKTPVISLCALTFYSMPVVLISGFAWPIYMLPLHLHIITYIFPSTYFMNIFRLFALNKLELFYAVPALTHLVIFFMVCFFINFIILNKKLKTNIKKSSSTANLTAKNQ